ncbi:MAG: HEAT repeat domain-containing protein [Candidatus Heimdallarchaeota archaeon]
MSESTIIEFESQSIWSDMYKKITTQRIIYWITFAPNLIGLGLVYGGLKFLGTPPFDILFIVGLIIGLASSVFSIIFAYLTFVLFKNYVLIETIKLGRKVDQLIFISQKVSFQDRRGYGRRLFAIAALADLGVKEALEPLSFIAQDKKTNIRKFALKAIEEINQKLTFYDKQGIPAKAYLAPYKTRDGKYISLFKLERKTVRYLVTNYIVSIVFMLFMLVIILSQFNIFPLGFTLEQAPGLILFFGFFIYLIEIVIIIAMILTRTNKVKEYVETGNLYDLITLVNKSNFGFLRFVKGIGISGLADIGNPEAIQTLLGLSQSNKTEIQNKAVVALDVISAKNDMEKRYFLQIL